MRYTAYGLANSVLHSPLLEPEIRTMSTAPMKHKSTRRVIECLFTFIYLYIFIYIWGRGGSSVATKLQVDQVEALLYVNLVSSKIYVTLIQ
jgi:hypothetical protein